MKHLILPKGKRALGVLLFWIPGATLTLFINLWLLTNIEKIKLFSDLTLSNPHRIPNLITYALFSSHPPNPRILGENIVALEGRALLLEEYLAWQKSPMAAEAKTFIKVADKYNLDWRLLPAIAGKESNFGKKVPLGSFNPFGWAIYGNTTKKFNSWGEGIERVGRGLREDYFNKGYDTLEKIESIYAPPSPPKGHPWLIGIEYFLWEIENYKNEFGA